MIPEFATDSNRWRAPIHVCAGRPSLGVRNGAAALGPSAAVRGEGPEPYDAHTEPNEHAGLLHENIA
jgi:hypothetical protein